MGLPQWSGLCSFYFRTCELDHDSFTLFHGNNNGVKLILLLMQCAGVIKFDKEIGCLVGEGPWIFVGFPDVVKVLFLLQF